VLQTAKRLFSRQGFHATGINQIVAEAGAPKGSLYFHFPGGKEQLASEAVSLGANELGEIIDVVLAQSQDPAAAVVALAEVLATRLENSDFVDGCPIATIALGAGAEADPIHEACRAGYDRWLTSIGEYLTRHGLAAATASEMALVALSSLEGALLLAQMQRDTAPIRIVAHHLAAVITQEIAS
jgi:TetR/AcrR family transcriptional regulator, lmrAB and yxaGH operons repressor